MTTHLQQFFKLCDSHDAGSVDREGFCRFCSKFEISDKDAEVIFDDLDLDHDGTISFEDFSRVFADYRLSAGLVDNDPNTTALDEHEATSEDNDNLTKVGQFKPEEVHMDTKNSNEEKLKWLIDELQSSEKRHLVPYLENTVEALLSNLHGLQEEKTQLEKTWKREKKQHERHLKRMEEEIDSQVKEAETKARLKAQGDVERERKKLQSKMDAEMENLQIHLTLFEKVNDWLKAHPKDNYDQRLDDIKRKLDEAVTENRQLRLSRLDLQTDRALARSELVQLRTLYEDKCKELESEREKILEVLGEQDHLSEQLSLLHDVNRRLQDTNDALRSAMEQTSIVSIKEGQMSRCKSGSIIGDYLDYGYSPATTYGLADNEDIDEPQYHNKCSYKRSKDMRRARSMDLLSYSPPKRNRNCDQRQESQNLEDQDSGVSTAIGSTDHDEGFSSSPYSSLLVREEEDCGHFELHHATPLKRPLSYPPLHEARISEETQESQEESSSEKRSSAPPSERMLKSTSSKGSLFDENELPKKKISEIVKQLGIQGTIVRTKSPRFLPSQQSESNEMVNQHMKLENGCGMEPKDETDESVKNTKAGVHPAGKACLKKGDNSEDNEGEKANKRSNDLSPEVDSLLTSVDEDLEFTPTGPADATFNVIFVGDAGVGKSSFALRISKGVFMRHMSSTLGVDFLMRMLRVDGLNVELQLWDTAGQERFRSITKSYFRKADGVMLLYDCTCEYSFLNVRQWSADVDSIAAHKIPLMLVANKIDLRPIVEKTGRRCISTDEGQKLAKECDATFIEASAKDGSNVLLAVANLIRSMSKHKDLQLSASTMQLTDVKQKKSNCCGKSNQSSPQK